MKIAIGILCLLFSFQSQAGKDFTGLPVEAVYPLEEQLLLTLNHLVNKDVALARVATGIGL